TSCLRQKFFDHLDLWDAVEYCHMHMRGLNFNRKAELVAKDRGLPFVGTSDAHELFMFGKNHTLVDAEKDTLSVFRAIRDGRTQHYAPPLSPWGAFKVLAVMEVWDRLLRMLTAQGRAKVRARKQQRKRSERAAEAGSS
ncbi:MAG: PHP-associated domain-containing protein, partial [Verrucomicrobiia bacterium]